MHANTAKLDDYAPNSCSTISVVVFVVYSQTCSTFIITLSLTLSLVLARLFMHLDELFPRVFIVVTAIKERDETNCCIYGGQILVFKTFSREGHMEQVSNCLPETEC